MQIGFGFTFLVPVHPGSPGQNPESCKTVVHRGPQKKVIDSTDHPTQIQLLLEWVMKQKKAQHFNEVPVKPVE